MMVYKGYSGQIEIDEEANLLFGRVLDIRDVVTFKGETIAEAKQAFQDSVDDYLEFCQQIGQDADRPFSGKLPFRTTPDHHRIIYIAATKSGKSMNAWMDEVLVAAAKELISV